MVSSFGNLNNQENKYQTWKLVNKDPNDKLYKDIFITNIPNNPGNEKDTALKMVDELDKSIYANKKVFWGPYRLVVSNPITKDEEKYKTAYGFMRFLNGQYNEEAIKLFNSSKIYCCDYPISFKLNYQEPRNHNNLFNDAIKVNSKIRYQLDTEIDNKANDDENFDSITNAENILETYELDDYKTVKKEYNMIKKAFELLDRQDDIIEGQKQISEKEKELLEKELILTDKNREIERKIKLFEKEKLEFYQKELQFNKIKEKFGKLMDELKEML